MTIVGTIAFSVICALAFLYVRRWLTDTPDDTTKRERDYYQQVARSLAARVEQLSVENDRLRWQIETRRQVPPLALVGADPKLGRNGSRR